MIKEYFMYHKAFAHVFKNKKVLVTHITLNLYSVLGLETRMQSQTADVMGAAAMIFS